MTSFATGRCPDATWFHESCAAAMSGALRVRRRSSRWSLEGRGARVDWDPFRRELRTCCPVEGFWIPQALRLIDLTTRWRRGELAGHASAVAVGRHVWLFAGHSGAGKSTAADLCRRAGARKIQDDLVFLKDGYLKAAVDWANPLRVNRDDAPVNGLCLLSHSRCSRLESVAPVETLASLAGIWGPPNGQPPEQWLAHLDRELNNLPVFRLHFRRDMDFVTLLNRSAR